MVTYKITDDETGFESETKVFTTVFKTLVTYPPRSTEDTFLSVKTVGSRTSIGFKTGSAHQRSHSERPRYSVLT